jgi:3-phenylpropionate/cinnamic acid dioxygenase small subunit
VIDPTLELLLSRQIERLLFDYAFHLDTNHPAELAALFVEDCEVSYAPNFGAKGMAEYMKTLEGVGSYFAGTSHHVSNICIDFTSEREARVRSAVIAVHRYRKDRPDGYLYGQYHDVVVRDGDAWKFKRRDLRTALSTNYHVKAFNPIGRAE